MALNPGTRLGIFEIVGALGAGGMGEVYRAADTRLKRHVAVKILPPLPATDPDRLARFQREAEVLASLNHPHIAAIFGLEEVDGVTALVMELVEGLTLAERIARGPIPVDESLAIARQIAEALEAAHEQRIIHRDLKPSNIKLRPDGTVKVLDFGLAKALEPGAGVNSGDVMTSPAMTQTGVILGTAPYMSPEQVKGAPADKRSDIWAFGCVLYEMLTGTRTFEGERVSDTIAEVLKSEPAWDRLPATTPPRVRLLLRRCLRKDTRRRMQDAGSVRIEIEDSLDVSAAGAPDVSQGRWAAGSRAALIAIAGSLGCAFLGGLAVWHLRPQASSPPQHSRGCHSRCRRTSTSTSATCIPLLRYRRMGRTWSTSPDVVEFSSSISGHFAV